MKLASMRQPGSSWLMLLLLLVVLAPSVCLLWFMNQAVKNERLAVRQKLADAYREHLVLAQQRLEAYFREAANKLDTESEKRSPNTLFHEQVWLGVADAVICYDATGRVVYPSGSDGRGVIATERTKGGIAEAERLEMNDPAGAAAAYGRAASQATNSTQAARALQAEARCLVRAGKTNEALEVLRGSLTESRYRESVDLQGRLIAPNAQLMALEVMGNADQDAIRPLVEALRKRVLDYEDAALSASQRRFLMHELRPYYAKVFGRDETGQVTVWSNRPLPHQTSSTGKMVTLRSGAGLPYPDDPFLLMLSAEDLAAAYLEAGQTNSVGSAIRETSLPGVWQFNSAVGRVVLLYKSAESLRERIAAPAGLQNLPSDVVVTLLPPGRDAEGAFVSLPAGPSLPDWKLALSLKDQKLFDSATDQRIASYVWIGVLVVLAVIVLALLILRLIRRQMAVTRLRNDLVANVTHELKTPLAGMRLLVDTLLNSEKLHEPTVREYLALIAKENLRLSRLIDNFLAFSRMERNKYALDFHTVPAQAIVDGAAAAVQERFHAPGCHFAVKPAANLPLVMADTDAMVTAVVNLLDNAWKYSGEDKQITLSAAAENGSVTFTVQDNGIGLSARDTKRVFKRFYQVDQSLSRSAGGCGLGLSIVKFIVTAHGGEVRVESEPGRGSRFSLVLPAKAAANTEVRKN